MDPNAIKNIYNAYINGKMTPDEEAEYEADIKSGQMVLPPSAALKAPMLDEKIINSYYKTMKPEERTALEADIEAGKYRLPAGAELLTENNFQLKNLGIFGKIKESITGNLRATEETEGVQDIGYMPELNTMSISGLKTAMGHMTASPEEAVQILKTNFPDVVVRKDGMGNFLLKSSIDGKEYAVKPGFQPSDITKVIGTALAFTPAGKAESLAGTVLANAATQAGIEGAQAASGGEFNAGEIGAAGGTAGLFKAISNAVKAGKARLFGKEGALTEEGKSITAMTTKDLGAETKKAAQGSEKAKKILAEQAMPDEDTVAAAQRLGIAEYLQPDHVTTNQAYREIAQAVKSIPGSQARSAELEGLKQVAKKADDLISQFGGTTDLSQLDSTLSTKFQMIQGKLDKAAETLYGRVRDKIPPKAPAPADNLIGFLMQRADEFGGIDKLSTVEKNLLKTLAPTEEGVQPTYAYLDHLRKELTAARINKQGMFKDETAGLVKKLEKELLKDQQAVAEEHGALKLFDAARRSVAIRKGVEDDMMAIFGKNLDGTILKSLSTGVKELQKGDVSKFVKLVKAVPKEMREEVVASGLGTAFGKTAARGELNPTLYAKWYEGVAQNQQAYNALFSNLPSTARKSLADLYKVADGIRKASKERITTGRLQVVGQEIQGTDNLIGTIYNTAKNAVPGAAAEVVTSSLGIPGVGMAAGITAAFMKKKTPILRAADDLISSPEFIDMATNGTNEAAKKVAESSVFKKFFKMLGEPKEMSKPEQWLLSIWQAKRNIQEENK